MKKLFLLVVLLTLLMVSCASKPDAKDCRRAWIKVANGSRSTGQIVQTLLNSEWPPDTNGALLQECLRAGWHPDTFGGY